MDAKITSTQDLIRKAKLAMADASRSRGHAVQQIQESVRAIETSQDLLHRIDEVLKAPLKP